MTNAGGRQKGWHRMEGHVEEEEIHQGAKKKRPKETLATGSKRR